jgi:hypothetical protein
VQFKMSELPDISRVKWVRLSCLIVMLVPVAMKGPTDAAETGKSIESPWSGTGDGMGTSKDAADCGADDGDAPVASTWVVAVPLMSVLPKAAAAPTTEDGRTKVVW